MKNSSNKNFDMKIFIAKPLDKKLHDSYKKDFINCEKEMNIKRQQSKI